MVNNSYPGHAPAAWRGGYSGRRARTARRDARSGPEPRMVGSEVWVIRAEPDVLLRHVLGAERERGYPRVAAISNCHAPGLTRASMMTVIE
jgi:hypothetical protein